MTVSSDVDARTAADFNRYMKRFPEMYQELVTRVHTYLPQASPVLLDLGAGSGLLTLELRRRYPEATVLGLDPSRTMLELASGNAQEASQGSPDLLQGVSEAIPLKSGSVDGIVSRFSLPYWKQPQASFQEMYRVLKPGGYIVLEGLNKNYPRCKQVALGLLMRVRAVPVNEIMYHLDAYKLAHTRAWVENLFAETGFTVVESEGKLWDWRFLVVAQRP